MTMTVTSKLKRSVAYDTSSLNLTTRTVALAASSTTPYLRSFGWEILGHDVDNIDFTRLNAPAPLLREHDTERKIGVLESYSLDSDDVLRTIVRLSEGWEGDQAMRELQEGTLGQTSIGYQYLSMRQIGEKDDIPVFLVDKWIPHEVSLVTIAADVVGAGLGRSIADESNAKDQGLMDLVTRAMATYAMEKAQAKPTPKLAKSLVTKPEDEEDKKPVDEEIKSLVEEEITVEDGEDELKKQKSVEDETNSAQADSTDPELERVTTLKTLGRAMDAEVFAEKCIAEGLTADQFIDGYGDFKRETGAAKKTKTKGQKMDKFDLGRAFQNLHTGKSEGYEGEVAQELGNKLRNAGQTVNSNALLVPASALKRSQTMGVATSGGNLLVQQELTNQFVSPLHPAYVMDRLGITRLNLSKSARFAKMEGTPFFLWSAAGAGNTRASRENAALTKTAFTSSTDTLTPVRGGTYFEFSDQLGMELDPSFVEMCKQDLSVTIALEEQRVLFKGNGINEPCGLDERAIQAVDFAGAIPTRDELLAMQRKIAAVNGIPGNWLMSATMLYTLMGVPVGTAGKFLVEDGLTLLGQPIVVSNQIPEGEIWVAQWDTVLWADFGALQIEIVRDADLALHGMNRYQVSLFADTNVKREALVVKGVNA